MNGLEFGYRNALLGREDKYPFLARCVENMEQARNPMIEWKVGPRTPDLEYGSVWKNKLEIVQTLFEAGSSLDESLDRHLAEVQEKLLYSEGKQGNGLRDPIYPRRLTGATNLLGRSPILSDEVSLYVLRDLVLHLNVSPSYDAPVNHRWLAEVTLMVKPSTYEFVAAATA